MTTSTTTELYCANHPDRETSLRCNRCEKPICPDCAVLTPTGYRCRECVRDQQKIFETAHWYDYPLAFSIAGLLSFIGSLLAARIGFFTLFLAPIAGIAIAEVIRRLVSRRRGSRLYRIVALGTGLGSAPLLLLILVSAVGGLSRGGLLGFFPLLWQAYYAFMVVSTTYYRLSGIQLGR